MITIIYSTHKDNQYNSKFKQHLEKTVGIKDIQILEFQNNNQYSLAEVYNKGISQSKYNIVVCCHNDIKLENGWGKKLLKDFNDNPDFGIIGKAGSCYFPQSGIYWERMNETMVGQVYHHPPDKNKWLSKYSAKLPFLIPVVTIDGLFITFDKNKIKHNFDETIGRFHFYDHSFCLPNYLVGVKLGVTTSFEITHESVGQPNQEFFDSKEVFLKKYGSNLPLDLKPEKMFIEEIKEKPIKNIKKTAIIIPTKSKLDLLFDCINSFIEHCNTNIFEIFIADTGSSDSEKDEIKNFIFNNESKVKINLIEYDYYNFAKINNDVVTNHISENFEFLLFCNNDIKVLNNVIYEMLSVFKENVNVGTVGARLHFGNNTVQHDGVCILSNNNNQVNVSHLDFGSYYRYNTNRSQVFGNTGALLMIRKNIFLKVGKFNENYIGCLEDVELNIMCLKHGLKNIFSGKAVAYHYESQTRNEDPETKNKFRNDLTTNLIPTINENYSKIKNYIIKI
jgi:GT2 family glycosyltransferase